MPIAQHENTLLLGGPPGVFDMQDPSDPGHASLVQSADIGVTVATEDILSLGFRGRSAIGERTGTVTLSVEAILTKNDDGFTPGSYRQLDDFAAVQPNFTLQTVSSDGAFGKQAIVEEPFVTGISYTFEANAEATTTWDFEAENVAWSDFTTVIGGTQLAPSNYFDPVEGSEITVTGISGCIQSCNFSSTLNRDEIFCLGQDGRFDRPLTPPFDVTVDIEALAGIPGDQLELFVTDWTLAVQGVITVGAGPVLASGLIPTDGGLTVGVGDLSTVSMSFRGDNLRIFY